ncbi:hypothetical protein EYB53_021735 [Candidatus Chloroploca sp. M-50]|uniref:Uncharacterized protein n=1 Tax=Candidatus Chloroploca mongolica TaxID=2528176 RepID=A0ABS4DFX6_9CHLR|nr:hypothetical protein [Candidatus Chloroploca mongolica]MBP1468348.1 hypothetical protein [Candidatus Chloroploca mongolica]
MNIALHIDRLVLDGLELGPGQARLVRAAVEVELTRLLTAGGLAPELAAGAAMPTLEAGTIATAGSEPRALGGQIAQAVYAGLGTKERP